MYSHIAATVITLKMGNILIRFWPFIWPSSENYIDDVHAVFENNGTCENFLKVLNVQHKNIQFSMQKSTDV